MERSTEFIIEEVYYQAPLKERVLLGEET